MAWAVAWRVRRMGDGGRRPLGPMAARRSTGQRLGGTRVAPAYYLDHRTRTLPQCARHPARTGGRKRASACVLRVAVWHAATTSRDVARVARSARLKFRLALFEPIFLQIFELQ
jgi:hypothetical protein